MSNFSLRIDSENEFSSSSADINLLSLGFGLLQGWIFLAVFSTERFVEAPQQLSGLAFTEQFDSLGSFGVSVFIGITLLVIGITNQRFLKLYVKDKFLYACAAVGVIGTLLLFSFQFFSLHSIALRIFADFLIGISIGSLLALWGIAFSRFEFGTILLNATLAMVLAIIVYIVSSNVLAFSYLGVITALLPCLSAFVLKKFTPTPFYKEARLPIFQPMQKRKGLFVLRVGLPLFLLGVAQGALRYGFITGVLKANDLTFDLLCGAACTTALALFVAFIVLYKRNHHSNALIRFMIPFVALGLFSLPQMFGTFSFAGCYFMMFGYIILLVITWTIIADTSQVFRLSPLFLVGILYGLLTIGAFSGTFIASNVMIDNSNLQLDASTLALAMMLVLIFSSAVLPQQNEMRNIICPAAAKAVYKADESKDNDINIENQQLVHEAELYLENVAQEAKAAKISSMNGTIKPERDTEKILEPEITNVIKPAEPSPEIENGQEHASAEGQRKGRFAMRCEELADTYMLSRRETEVLFLLAKGHNAEFIQNKLCVSRSTAKTHINHIYRKMDIHTQQELLNMVDDRKDKKDEIPSLKPPITNPDTMKPGKPSQNKGVRKNIFAE